MSCFFYYYPVCFYLLVLLYWIVFLWLLLLLLFCFTFSWAQAQTQFRPINHLRTKPFCSTWPFLFGFILGPNPSSWQPTSRPSEPNWPAYSLTAQQGLSSPSWPPSTRTAAASSSWSAYSSCCHATPTTANPRAVLLTTRPICMVFFHAKARLSSSLASTPTAPVFSSTSLARMVCRSWHGSSTSNSFHNNLTFSPCTHPLVTQQLHSAA